ncbi:MAG: IS21 family transposase [Niabella sp.]
MSKIKQLLRLHQQGVSNRKIATILGLYKGTVNSYIQKLDAGKFPIEELLELEDPVLESKFNAGSPSYLEERFEQFKTLIPYLEKELQRKYVTRKLLWQEYKSQHADGYGYTQFCFHLNQLSVARKASAIIQHDPGMKLEVDFAGEGLSYADLQTGEAIKVQVFIAALPYSGYAYALAVPSQKTDDFLYALQCCLKHLGGVPQAVVPDNLKAAVVKADRYEPLLNRVMEDVANHYGFVVLPARPARPKDKPTAERTVNLIYQRVYARLRNQVFFSIGELNTAISQAVKELNQTRMQQHSYSRQEKYLADEKSYLKPLPQADFEIKYYADLTVMANNCIYLARDKQYYSVPYQYIGNKVQIIYTRTLVCIYKDGACIATHQHASGQGYTTAIEHFASSHQHYMRRSPAYYIGKAHQKSVALTRLVERIFKVEKIPELAFRNCDALLSLQRKTDPLIFEKACNIAYDNDLMSYKRLWNQS